MYAKRLTKTQWQMIAKQVGERCVELNEELAALDSVNQKLLERCLTLEIENGRLKREVQPATDI
jgi:hypothetical protein